MALLSSAFLLLLGVAAMQAADDRCLMTDSCFFKTQTKSCSCEPDCHLYENCCPGAQKEPSHPSGPAFRCYGRRTRDALFVRASCKPGYRGHPQEVVSCVVDDEDEEDVVNNLLVTSRKTKVTYWNKQCARCNDEDMSNLELWDIVARCNAEKGVTKKMANQLLHFDLDKQSWGVMIGELFIACVVYYAPPASLDQIKYCNRNLVESCPPGFPDQETVRKCSEIYAERKLRNGSDVYFRNVHCAHCNGIDEKDIECSGMWSGPKYNYDDDFRDFPEIVWSGGDWLRREPGRKFECGPGYAYDPFHGRCRRYRKEGGRDVVLSSVRSRDVVLSSVRSRDVVLSSAPVCSRVPMLLLATLVLLLLL